MGNQPFHRISVVGLGYIGLPTAAMFASRKIHVVGLDVDPRTVDTINRGEIHIVEPDLDIAVRSAVSQGYLRATTRPEPAQAYLIAVPTPFVGDDRRPDLRHVRAAALSIAPVLEPGNLVILESTSPVGSTEALSDWLAEARPDLTFPRTHGEASDIRVAHCPERVLPGKVMQELITNDRVIGGMTARCSQAAAQLYRIFVTGECVLASNPRVAEMSKLTENSFRDVNIAFANELSMICAKLDISVWELISLANRHPRVDILQPGPGVGGHCIAVDPWFIVASTPDQARLIRTAREVNDHKRIHVLEEVRAAIGELVSGHRESSPSQLTLAIYGLTFKPNIDDLRESPALAIARELASGHSGPVLVVEPNIPHLPSGLGAAKLADYDVAAREADVHVLLVDHAVFRGKRVPEGVKIDTRGLWI